MMHKISNYRYLTSGVLAAGSVVLYALVSVAIYEKYPTGFWFLSAFFILFSAEHIYNFIGGSKSKLSSGLQGTFWHRMVAWLSPGVIVAITWWLASGS